MNYEIKLGEMNTLKILRETDNGLYLQALNEEEILLPNSYVTKEMDFDDTIDVFVYTDSEDRLVATTTKPLGFKNEFVFAKVVDVARFGAFVDINLPKDLLVPKNKQKNPFERGDRRIIRIVEDEETNRLIGIEKITSFLSTDTSHFKRNDEVSIMIIAHTPLGYKVIINHQYEGIVYKNEVFEKLRTGDIKKAYIKDVRKDKKIDVSLQPIGDNETTKVARNIIVGLLENNNNFLPYTSKSDANIIQKIFGLSKKNFKKTLQILIANNTIELSKEGIKLKS
jgi:predicted RNA-binding protein (virulence factor B family)